MSQARSGIHQNIIDQATDQWRIFVLMHVSTTKESTLYTCYDVLFHNYQQFVSFETYISVF